MFDRSSIKQAAKIRLDESRWMAVLVTLVGSYLISMGSGSASTTSIMPPTAVTDDDLLAYYAASIVLFIISLIILALSILLTIFLLNIIQVGMCNWFLKFSRGENPSFGVLFSGFKNYRSNMAAMGLRYLYISLWTLLFIVPGIIKSFSYAFVPYILNDNPNLSAKEALNISKTMTHGFKWRMFVFDLSFFGWHILSFITCGILGIFHVYPYLYTSQATLYDVVKCDALYQRRVVDPAKLNMPESPDNVN